MPAPGLIALVLVSRFVDHLPHYRQQDINARLNVHTPRSTLASWSGQGGAGLQPLFDIHREFVLGADVVHADELPTIDEQLAVRQSRSKPLREQMHGWPQLALVSGNILHSFSGWLVENGDPSFRISFTTPVNAFSATFAGVSTAADVTLYVYNGASLLGSVSGAGTGQFMLSFAAASITAVAVRPGTFDDWVGVDDISFTPLPVPEPGTYLLMALGISLIAFRLRRSA